MTIMPNEILEKEFSTRFRGYNPEEVDAFLEEVSEELAAVIQERNALRDQVAAYEAKLEEMGRKEEEFRQALTSAHRLAEEMKEQSAKKADLIIERAKLDAERMVEDAHKEALRLEERVRSLRRLQREAIYKIRATIEGYLNILDEELLPPEDVDEKLHLVASEARMIQADTSSEEGGEVLGSDIQEGLPKEAAPAAGIEDSSVGGPGSGLDDTEILPGRREETEETGTKDASQEQGKKSGFDVGKVWPAD